MIKKALESVVWTQFDRALKQVPRLLAALPALEQQEPRCIPEENTFLGPGQVSAMARPAM